MQELRARGSTWAFAAGALLGSLCCVDANVAVLQAEPLAACPLSACTQAQMHVCPLQLLG